MDAFLELESWCASALLPPVSLKEHYSPAHAQHLLRFELGYPHENSTQERADQATERASAIFEAVFSADAPIDLVIFDYPSRMTGELDLATVLPKGLHFEERTLEPSPTRRDAVQQRLTRLPRGSIEHRTLFRTIANSDMGFEPHLAKSLNFYGRSTAQCFYMYDDRGCVVAGAPFHQEALVERFGDWVIQWF